MNVLLPARLPNLSVTDIRNQQPDRSSCQVQIAGSLTGKLGAKKHFRIMIDPRSTAGRCFQFKRTLTKTRGWLPVILSLLLMALFSAASSAADDSPVSDQQLHWAYRRLPITHAPSSNPAKRVDELILKQLRLRQIGFSPEADRRTLCRRLHLDLTGLPPAPEQVRQFLDDTSPTAIESLIDRLIASPEYGERWGRQWLDVVGYADSNGYIRHDSLRPLAYRYRDYVIQSLNDDIPYDRFWKEQLAGDELIDKLPTDDLSAEELRLMTATHFLRNPPDGTDDTEGNEITRVMERYAVLESLMQTTMSSMFGVTIDCARCHDHKFDPIPQKDYYSVQAVFFPAFNVKDWVQPKNRWIYSVPKSEVEAWRRSNEQADHEIARLREEHQSWISLHRPPAESQWQDDFSTNSLTAEWSPTAPGDSPPESLLRTRLDSDQRPAARLIEGRLSILAAAAGDSRWLSTIRRFDWSPDTVGDWIQVTFDLVDSHGLNGMPAERVGYYIALHDRDDDSAVAGGNILFDGDPAGGASVVVDYPGSDQRPLGQIGQTAYLPGRRLGVRVTRLNEAECLLEQVANGKVESNSIKLPVKDLPDGGFGFELCCSRDFVVDHLLVESSNSNPTNPDRKQQQQDFAAQLAIQQQQLNTAIAAINEHRPPEPARIAFTTDLSQKPPDVPLLKRGDYFQPGELVTAGPLSALSEADDSFQPVTQRQSTGRRRAFADWATKPGSRAAALLARVQVDRIWRGHFGKGLVPSPENFGVSGVRPSHPELLEWLAAEFVRSGWSQKSMHRLIVSSQTYLQSSEINPNLIERDPENMAYSRFPMHRLEAEQIRDSMLSVAGVLNRKRGGPAVETVDRGNRQITVKSDSKGDSDEADRRSIYTRYRRRQPSTFLRTFDQPGLDPNCVTRGSTAVVAQSLAMLNGEFSVRMGHELAKSVSSNMNNDDEALIAAVFERAVQRQPTEEELQQSKQFLIRQRTRSIGDNTLQTEALDRFCQTVFATNEPLYLP